MGDTKRCAILDTDFISKLYYTHKDENNRMIYRVLEITDFNFVCHEQTRVELSRHNQAAFHWLDTNSDITVYSDHDLMQLMISLLGGSAYTFYSGMLRRSCDNFSSGFYVQYYSAIDDNNPHAAFQLPRQIVVVDTVEEIHQQDHHYEIDYIDNDTKIH